MLKQILKDMYVDPELLAELPEEQQQILFFKIREEQKRRYYECEKQEKKKPNKKPNKKKSSKPTKNVRILEDSINQPWTWIMGEHANDIPLEEIWGNLGNKDWKPSKDRENQQPISKVQALIHAQNKNKTKSNNTNHQTQSEKENNRENLNVNNNNSVKPDQVQNNISKITPETKITPKPDPVTQPPKVAEKPVVQKIARKKPVTPPSTINPSSSPSVDRPNTKPITETKNDTVDGKVNKATPPPLPTKPPTGKTPNPKSKGTKTVQNSDSDEYENMAELADTVSNLREKEQEDKEWKTQLKRFKDADRRRSLNARRASMQIKRQSQLNLMQEQKLNTLKKRFERQRSQRDIKKPVLPPKPTNLRTKHPAPCPGRSPKPASKGEAIEWFKETQTAEILASVDDNNKLPIWFHGLITRQKAESLLEDKKPGDYLIRVSERIWGYALSYKDEQKTKHFLIDASEANCYHFFGNDQIRHPGLEQLIAFHQDEVISYGGEILKDGVGQEDSLKPDYDDIIDTSQLTSEGMNRNTNDTAF